MIVIYFRRVGKIQICVVYLLSEPTVTWRIGAI